MSYDKTIWKSKDIITREKLQKIEDQLEVLSEQETSGNSGTSDYLELENKPQINGVTLAGNKSLTDLGAAAASDVAAKYTKPGTGIPASDLSSTVQASLNKADTALQGENLTSVVNNYIETNFSNPSSPPLDRTLSTSSSAAPADMVGELKSAVDSIENLDEKTVLSGTYSGTQSLRVTQEFPAGKYHVLIDSITSSDTDATTCQFGFYNGGTTIAYALFKREVPIDIYIDLPSKATSMAMFAANNYAKGASDTFTFSGLKIKTEYPLISAISDLQNNNKITTPTGFSWTDNPLNGHLYRTEAGIMCDLDVADLKPAATKTYWVSPDGSDSNTGADSEHPLQSLGAVFAKADVDKIVVMDGFYPVSLAPQHVNGLSRSISVIAADGAHPVISTNSGSHTWAKTSEKTYVYETEIDSNAVWDIDNAIPYIWVNSIDEVDNTAASFYTDGMKTYVHTKDGSGPSQDIRCCTEADNFHITANGDIFLYLEGLSIVGGSSGAFRMACDGTNRAKMYGKNCLFVGATTWGACYLEGVESIMQNCEACYSKADGFGMHRNNETVTVSPRAVEINCRGHHNGIAGNTTSNGSTVHAGGKVIRINGEYHHNVGPNVADVHNNTESWNIGCHAWTSMRATGGIDFLASDGTAKMWLDNCSAFGSTYSLYVSGSVEIYVRNGIFVTVNVAAGGILKSY